MGMGKSHLNEELTLLFSGTKFLFFALWKIILAVSEGDHNREVTLLVR